MSNAPSSLALFLQRLGLSRDAQDCQILFVTASGARSDGNFVALVGALQWVVQIGRFNVATSVMTLSSFCAAPCQGNLDRIHGFLSKYRFKVIRVRTEEPDHSMFPEKVYVWAYACYAGAKEVLPDDAPPPLGKRVVTTAHVDANLYHDLVSGRAVTGVLHLANKTPIDWYTKLQSTCEAATFGSKSVAGETATDQVIDLRNTFWCLGVPIEGSLWMFGNNETVANSVSMPHSCLHKRHNALACHCCQEAIAARII